MPEPLATMADVAARAGVSVATVSRALRGSELVSRATAERVRAAAAELGFSVSRTASGLATGRLGRIAVLSGGRCMPGSTARSWTSSTAGCGRPIRSC